MNLFEFKAIWVGNYSKEQEESYRIMYGDDKSTWPETEEYTLITIDLDRVCRFNPHTNANFSIIELSRGESFAIVIPYSELRDLMGKFYGVNKMTKHNAV